MVRNQGKIPSSLHPCLPRLNITLASSILPLREWCRGTGNGSSGQFISPYLCLSSLLMMFPCSSTAPPHGLQSFRNILLLSGLLSMDPSMSLVFSQKPPLQLPSSPCKLKSLFSELVLKMCLCLGYLLAEYNNSVSQNAYFNFLDSCLDHMGKNIAGK